MMCRFAIIKDSLHYQLQDQFACLVTNIEIVSGCIVQHLKEEFVHVAGVPHRDDR